MKTFSKAAAAALILGFALTGCSAANPPNSSGAVSQEKYNEAEVKTAINKTVSEFYTKSIEKAPEAVAQLQLAGAGMTKLLTAEDVAKLESQEDPFAAIESLSTESQKKIADYYKSLDPVGDYYDYTGMTESEKAIVSLTSVVSTTFLTYEEVAKAAKSITVDNVTVTDANNAVVKFTVEGQDPAVNMPSAKRTDLIMKKVGNDWKINGVETFKQYKKAAADALEASKKQENVKESDAPKAP